MTGIGTDPEEMGTELDPNREAQIRQLHEELGPVRTLAAVGARKAIGDLLGEIGRLRRVVGVTESRHEEIHGLLATVDGLKSAEAWDLGMSIAAILDGPARRPEAVADACARCGHPFDPTDTTFDGHARERDTLFCRRCVDRCHESEDAGHRCPVCNQDGVTR